MSVQFEMTCVGQDEIGFKTCPRQRNQWLCMTHCLSTSNGMKESSESKLKINPSERAWWRARILHLVGALPWPEDEVLRFMLLGKENSSRDLGTRREEAVFRGPLTSNEHHSSLMWPSRGNLMITDFFPYWYLYSYIIYHIQIYHISYIQ